MNRFSKCLCLAILSLLLPLAACEGVMPAPESDAYVAPTPDAYVAPNDGGGPQACHYDAECGNGFTCQYGWCLPKPPETDNGPQYACVLDEDCDAPWGKIGYCANGECKERDLECPDGLVVEPIHGKECVNPTIYCEGINDGDLCTIDTCDYIKGVAKHTPKLCDDKNPSTFDWCDKATGECKAKNCLDDDACTVDTWDADGVCKNELVKCPDGFKCDAGTCVLFCKSNTDCADDWFCTIDKCVDGKCVYEVQNCGDGKAETKDTCVEAGDGKFTCEHVFTLCAGCDDENPCTEDGCDEQKGKCTHTWTTACDGVTTICSTATGNCVPVFKPECSDDLECDDENPCTDDRCQPTQGVNACVNTNKVCETGESCDAATGECFKPAACQTEKPVDTDKCSPYTCDGSTWIQKPLPCDGGTICDQSVGQCVAAKADPTCVDGTMECVTFEVLGSLVSIAKCQDHNWLQVKACGLVADKWSCQYDAGDNPECKKF